MAFCEPIIAHAPAMRERGEDDSPSGSVAPEDRAAAVVGKSFGLEVRKVPVDINDDDLRSDFSIFSHHVDRKIKSVDVIYVSPVQCGRS